MDIYGPEWKRLEAALNGLSQGFTVLADQCNSDYEVRHGTTKVMIGPGFAHKLLSNSELQIRFIREFD